MSVEIFCWVKEMVEGSKKKEDAPEGRKEGEEMRGRGGRIRRNCRARVARNTDVSLAERCILLVVSAVIMFSSQSTEHVLLKVC